jgi:hypothetical protein
MTTKPLTAALALAAALVAAPAAAHDAAQDRWPGSVAGAPAPRPRGVPAVLQHNLATFDDLDFRVYTGQQWQDLHLSHTEDVVVHWPDGRVTRGRDVHLQDLKVMFGFAPDNRILEHPVRFGTHDGEWTAVTGWLEGTFTRPMVLADGTAIPPTGKAYRIPMATIGHWNEEGVMFEEFLFWDNGEFMRQIGLAP